MYLLYLDDSGSAANPKESHFVLGGVIVHKDKSFYVNKYLDELADEICTDNPQNVEFHACDIFGGREAPWDTIKDKPERIDIIKRVLDVAVSEKLPVLACAVDKSGYPLDSVIQTAFEDVISRFQAFLNAEHYRINAKNSGKKQRTQGLVIFDKCAYEKDIQRLALLFRAKGTRYRNIANIQEVPLFVDSKASRAIQLADHVSYAVFRRYNAKDLTYYDIIEDSFDDRLFHMTKSHRTCTCPACLKKRLSPGPPSADH